MVVHEKVITTDGFKPAKLIGLGDIHLGSKQFDRKALKADIERIRKMSNAHVILMGDLIDSIIATDTKRYRASEAVHMADDVIDRDIDGLCEMLMPISDKIIGSLTGNHEDNITKRCGTNPAKRIAEKLGVPFLGYTTLLRLVMRAEKNGKRIKSQSITIFASHGHGGGARTIAGSLNSFDRVRNGVEADVYLFGHVHRRQVTKEVKLAWGGKDRPKFKTQILGVTGCYLKTYSKDTTPSYSEAKGYSPSAMGCLEITLDPGSHGIEMGAEL